MNTRLVKILFSGAVGLYIALVCFNNIFNYEANFQFVTVISNMDDIFSKEKNSWRSINSVFLHHLLFLFIITWELLIAVLIWVGFFKMVRKFRSGALEFKNAKKYAALGLSLGVLLWFTAFIAIGGEWFLMWQSKSWNAQPTAFMLTCCFLLFLIHHNREDD